MVDARHKVPGRRLPPPGRGVKTKHARPAAGRGRHARDVVPRGSRPRRVRQNGRRVILPSERWREMRRVTATAEAPASESGGPQDPREQPSPSEQPSVGAEQQTAQTPARHGRLGRLFERGR